MRIRRLAAAMVALVFAFAPSAGEAWQDVTPGYRFTFPADYGAHEQYRDEWWYYSGNVTDDRGRKFGFELTIFRYGVEQPISGGSAWDINDIYFAHFALADVSGHRFVYDDRAGRGALGEAGAATGDERAWVGDWRIGRDARGEFDIVASDGGDALDLVLAPSKAATPNGRDGTFADGSCADLAHHEG